MLSSLDLALPRLFSLEEAEGSWGNIFTVHTGFDTHLLYCMVNKVSWAETWLESEISAFKITCESCMGSA